MGSSVLSRSMSLSRSRGFTVVELMVVGALMALLTAMLLPAISAARGRSVTVTCVANLGQIGLAYQMYGAEYDGATPASRLDWGPSGTSGDPVNFNGWLTTTNYSDTPPVAMTIWQQFLWPYVGKSSQVFTCPAHDGIPMTDYGNYADPTMNNTENGQSSLAMWHFNYGQNKPLTLNKFPKQFRNATATMRAMDYAYYQVDPNNTSFCKGMYYMPGAKVGWTGWPTADTLPPVAGMRDDAEKGRHPARQLNVLYVDGHVGQVSAPDFAAPGPLSSSKDVFWTGQ